MFFILLRDTVGGKITTFVVLLSILVLGLSLKSFPNSSPTVPLLETREETIKLEEAYSGNKHVQEVAHENNSVIFVTEGTKEENSSTTRMVTTTEKVAEETTTAEEVEFTEEVEETTEAVETTTETETKDDESEEEVEVKPDAPSEYLDVVADVHFTGYCLCKKCCGKSKSNPEWGIARNGYKITPDIGEKVVAVDPDVIPLGSIVYVDCPGDIPDYGYAYACDTGSAINGKDVDLYIDQESGPWYDSKNGTTVYIVETDVSHEEWRESELNACKGMY